MINLVVEKDIIKLNYNVSSKGIEKLASIYFNDKVVHFLEDRINIDEAIKELSLTKMDLVVLEKRPLTAILSMGHFKLYYDIAENLCNGSAGHYIRYERIVL